MVNRGTNHLGIDRSKTAGGRNRRMAANRKESLAASNLYRIRSSDFGIYRDGDEWIVTVLSGERMREKLVSDRRGGTTTEVVESKEVNTTDPKQGISVARFDTKSKASGKYWLPDSWEKHATGEYYGSGQRKSFKVDRDEWRKWVSVNR